MEKKLKVSFTFGQPITSATTILLVLVTVALLALWILALIDQLFNFATFKSGMLNHSFPDFLGYIIIGVLPILELTTITLLVSSRTIHYGMWLSSVILFVFTVYIGLGVFTDVVTFECYCSKLVADKSWEWHFGFNLIFLFLSGIGIYLTKIQRSGLAGGRAAEGGSAKRP